VVKINGHYDNAVGTSDAPGQDTIRADLTASRPAAHRQVLELVPGMLVTQRSGDDKANQYFLRRFKLDHRTDFATYVDGVRSTCVRRRMARSWNCWRLSNELK
jgi:hypothetical protein